MLRSFVLLCSGSVLLALAGTSQPTRAALPEDPPPACDAVWYADSDADGFGVIAHAVVACHAPSGFTTLPGDCDDADAHVNPGAAEVCNERDDDCDGSADDAAPVWFRDADGDGYGDPANTWSRCDRPDGYAPRAGDCDDSDPDAFPGSGC